MNLNARATNPAWGLTVLRIVTGIIFFVHGVQKVTQGVGGVAGFFGSLGIPLPAVAAVVVIVVELLGGLALILGLGTRWVAIPLAIDMLVALVTVHLPNGFFAQSGGYEFVLLMFAANVALILGGSGVLALDNALGGRSRSVAAATRTA